MADSSNTGRNFLIAGIILGVGAAATGVYVLNSPAPESLVVNMANESSQAADLTQEASRMTQDALTRRRMVDAAPPLEAAYIPRDKVEGKKVPRYTPLFFAPAIWQVPDAGQKKNVAVDLLEEGARPLHFVASSEGAPGSKAVPNSWFYAYGMEGSLCMADALQQDPDGDGFSNAEEFVAGTDPTDAASMPPFVMGRTVKLATIGEKSVSTHWMELSSASYFDENSANISIFSENGQRLLQHKELKPGQKFGLGDKASGPMAKDRFTLEKIDKKTDASGNTANFIRVKDAYTALNDAKEFDLVAGSKSRRLVCDTALKFRITAGPEKGKEIAVQLGQQFDVPGFKDTHCVLTDAGKKRTQAKVSVNGGDEIAVSAGDPDAPEKKN